jgi:hypothetical protein
MSEPTGPITMTLKLRVPIQLSDSTEEVRELQLREPTLEELIAAGTGNVYAVEKVLIAQVSNQPPALIGKLCLRDYQEASVFLGRLLAPDSPPARSRPDPLFPLGPA